MFQLNTIYQKRFTKSKIINYSICFALCVPIILAPINAFTGKLRSSVLSTRSMASSYTASQYVLAKWVDSNLSPENGPIGFFYLGVSYHLPRFEIADFLGKADEEIAQTAVKWGAPGHNKWDISKTLAKWNPQAIIPPNPSDFSSKEAIMSAEMKLKNKSDMGFAPALVAHPSISEKYNYCFIKTSKVDLIDTWGLFLRKDIAINSKNISFCRASALSN